MGYKKEWYIRLDVKKQFDNDVMNLVSQNVYGNVFNIQLFDEGSAIDLTDVNYVGITILKSDGTNVVGSCEVVDELNGKVRYTVDIQAIAALGLTQATIELYSQDIKVSSTQFNFNVIADLYEGTDASVESTTEYPLLTELLADASNMDQKVKDLEIQFDNAINGVTTDTEIIDSRYDTSRGVTYTTLKERLDKDSEDILYLDKLSELNAKDIYNIVLARKYEAKDTPLNGLFFDGFVDYLMRDNSISTALIDKTNKLLKGLFQFIGSLLFSNKSLSVASSANYVTTLGYQIFTMPVTAPVSSLDLYFSKPESVGSTDKIQAYICSVVDDLPTDTVIVDCGSYTQSSGTSGKVATLTFAETTLTAGEKYAIKFESNNNSATGTRTWSVHGGTEDIAGYPLYNASKTLITGHTYLDIKGSISSVPLTYRTFEQDMEQDISEAILYITKKLTGTATMTPTITVYDTTPAFEVMTKDTTYSRDLGDGYIEERYTYTVSSPTGKQNIKINLELSNPDNETCEVKEYGVIIR